MCWHVNVSEQLEHMSDIINCFKCVRVGAQVFDVPLGPLGLMFQLITPY